MITIASGKWSPKDIAVDPTSVYWDTYEGDIVKAPLDGGSPVTLASGQHADGIAVASSNVYWTNWSYDYVPAANPIPSVAMVPAAGGATVPLVSDVTPAAFIAVDATSVYWTTWTATATSPSSSTVNAVMRAALDGGAAYTLASVPGSNVVSEFGGFGVDGTSVYWSDSRLMKVGLDGGTAVTLLSTTEPVFGVTIGSTNAYWVNHAGNIWEISSVPLAGGASTTLASITAPFSGLGVMAADSTALYLGAWWGPVGVHGYTGALMKLSLQ
jgi:hypothetical protein